MDKFHFSTVSPPLLRLRLRITLFSLYIRRLTAARLLFRDKESGSFCRGPWNACGAQIGGWGWVHFRKCRKAGVGCILFTKCSRVLLRHRDLSRLPYTYDLQSAYVPCGRYGVPIRAATPNLFGECTLRYGLFDLQSAYVLCLL